MERFLTTLWKKRQECKNNLSHMRDQKGKRGTITTCIKEELVTGRKCIHTEAG